MVKNKDSPPNSSLVQRGAQPEPLLAKGDGVSLIAPPATPIPPKALQFNPSSEEQEGARIHHIPPSAQPPVNLGVKQRNTKNQHRTPQASRRLVPHPRALPRHMHHVPLPSGTFFVPKTHFTRAEGERPRSTRLPVSLSPWDEAERGTSPRDGPPSQGSGLRRSRGLI